MEDKLSNTAVVPTVTKDEDESTGMVEDVYLDPSRDKSITPSENQDCMEEEVKNITIAANDMVIAAATIEGDDAHVAMVDKSSSSEHLEVDATDETNAKEPTSVANEAAGKYSTLVDTRDATQNSNELNEGDDKSENNENTILDDKMSVETTAIAEEATIPIIETVSEPMPVPATPRTASLNITFGPPSSATSTSSTAGYTNSSWKTDEASRKLVFCGGVGRFEKGRFFWSSPQYVKRTLALYDDPQLLVIAREPNNVAEVRGALRGGDSQDPTPEDSETLSLLDNYLIAETVVDLKMCKLRLSMLTTPTSTVSDPNESDSDGSQHKSVGCRRMSCFEIITPSENILISAMKVDDSDTIPDVALSEESRSTFAITSRWEDEISSVILSSHGSVGGDSSSEQAWRHQMILGTLHSHVVSGNYALLEKSLEGKGSPNSPHRKIDERDEAGLTALHYACYRRSHKAVSILLNAGADCTLPTIKGRNTPCHICCELLDTKSLSVILSCSKPRRADPNALNEMSETPMYIALMKGNSSLEVRNPVMCLKALEAWGGQLIIPLNDRCTSDQSPIYKLACSWDDVGLKSAFQFYGCQYPIVGEQADGFGRSLGAIFQYPLHAALISLRIKVVNINDNDKTQVFANNDKKSIANTLKLLCDLGFEPNERPEEHSTNPTELNEMVGFTPLQILAAAVLDLIHIADSIADKAASDDLAVATEIIRSSADILVARGARVWTDAPLGARPNRGPPTIGSTGHPSQFSVILRKIDPSNINMEKNKELVKRLGGMDRLAAIGAKWLSEKTMTGCGRIFLPGKGMSVLDCMLPGGSDHTSCAICWKKFGKIMNRKHACRASRRYLCEECSGKSVLIDKDPHRVSDGQFNVTKCTYLAKLEKDRIEKAEKREVRKAQIDGLRKVNNNKLLATKRSEDAAKQELFGSVGRSVKNFFIEEIEVEEQDSSQMVNDNVSGVMNSLNETRNAFIERGQKLENLVEKTNALNNASEEFAKMAKELADSQEKGIFGW